MMNYSHKRVILHAMKRMTKAQQRLSWASRIIVAIILLQTLFFKFTAAPESVYIFEQTGLGDFGRIGTGVIELIASILLLVPGTVTIGALLALGTMSGAISFHLTSLGIQIQDDGGLLFGMSIVVFGLAALVLWLHRKEIPVIGGKL